MCRFLLLFADCDRRSVGGDFDQLHVMFVGAGHRAIINGKTAEHMLLRVKDGRGPAGAQSVNGCEITSAFPKGVAGNVLDNNGFPSEYRGAARARSWTNRQAISRSDKTLWQTWGGTVPKMNPIRIQQLNRAK